MGNSHPSLFPYEPLPCADGDLIITAGNDGQFRKLCDGARTARAGRRPALRPQPGPDGQPGRAAAAAGGAAADPDQARVVPRHHRRRGAVRTDQHHRRRGGVRRGDRARPGGRGRTAEDVGAVASATRSPCRSPRPDYRLPPPGLDEHGAEIRAWLEEPTPRGYAPRSRGRDRAGVPHLARHLRRRSHPAAGPGSGRRPDGTGRLRRAGLLAGHPAPADPGGGPGLRGGAGRAGRPRLHPDRDRGPADLPVGAGLAAGRAGRRAARRRFALPRRDRGLRDVPARGLGRARG